ncbi:MAG: M23 family metallopeptidase [bacterium]|nr:M23 family metallopeptidase [bacterium]
MNGIKNILVFFILAVILFSQISSLHAGDKKPKKIKKKKIDVSLLSVSQKINDAKADEDFYAVKVNVAEGWKPIMVDVREAKLSRNDAVDLMNRFTNQLWDFMEARIKAKKTRKYSVEEWVFPVKGYTPNAIGGSGGSGYVPSGFDFFEVNSGGHPAHDVFIDDNNQDCIDDGTGDQVKILSMSGGIVVETRKDWTTERMDLRGGNIVYVYDNYTNGFFYYAHLKDVNVNVGELVKPGLVLGTMGRTGKNAYPSRSPTHLHIMYLRSFDGDLRPENIYPDLVKAKVIQ